MGKCICSHLDEVVIRVLLRLRSLMYLVVATLTALQLFLCSFPNSAASCVLWTELYLPLQEGNGTALQYSCLENPVDGGAW